MFKKITLIIFSVLFLFGCSASPEPISNNADSYKNKVVFDSQTDSEKSIDLIQTSNSDSLAETETDNSELTSSALLVSDSDSTALENPQIAYSDGVFNKLHEELMKKYSDGYQSFSAESLIDIWKRLGY